MTNDNDPMTDAERVEDLALRYLERNANIWIGRGLPLPVLARAMIGAGTSCIDASQGHEMAVEVVDTIRAALEENRLAPPSLAS